MIADLQTNKEGVASEEFLPLVLFDEDLVVPDNSDGEKNTIPYYLIGENNRG